MSIVWRDKVLSSYNGNIESVLIQDGSGNNIEADNGVFVKLRMSTIFFSCLFNSITLQSNYSKTSLKLFANLIFGSRYEFFL